MHAAFQWFLHQGGIKVIQQGTGNTRPSRACDKRGCCGTVPICCETFGILSGLDKDALLTAHNYYRSIVSPVAANMLKMRWSEKLEATAQSIANECTLKQSGSAVTLDSISLNKYVVTSSIPDYNSAVSQWLGENENCIYESNTCSNHRKKTRRITLNDL
ncbi:hypothetical protein EMCRGX_G030075 [Ephydatia muelleri]